jgi:hypothetical protein
MQTCNAYIQSNIGALAHLLNKDKNKENINNKPKII